MTVRSLVALVVVSLALSGCRIGVGTEVDVDARGGGELTVAVRIDGATLGELERSGVDVGLDVELTLGPDSGWSTGRLIDADGGLVLTYRRAFADGAEATDLLRELTDGVAPQDPALRLDVEVTTSPRGAVRIEGTGGVSAPATLGVRIDDRVVGPTEAELAELVAEAVRAELVVRVAGRIVSDDADTSDGRVARWELPVAGQRDITLVADGPGWWSRVPGWIWPGMLVAGAAAAVIMGRSRRVDPAGGVSPAE